ncbi:MAG: TIGR03746 family integrating conjugative element protein [Gammaproteobacteria bacterium]|nr:TIGR03746 family integrating conjugative element protein [Gammaproteobacteria bacterium]MYG68404.1 TIGR03746 family integrating conjugative element protein [Gammaproteobacteria bacterium]
MKWSLPQFESQGCGSDRTMPGQPKDDTGPEFAGGSRAGTRPGLLERQGIGFVQSIETVRAINRALLIIILCLAAALIALSVALMSSRDWITVYVPPDITRGSFITAGTPSPATVYGFAAITLQGLYHWPADGEKDYLASIDSQAPYLTPAFRRQLMEDHARLSNRAGINELKGRGRALFPIPDRLYSPDRITWVGDGVWSVTLEFRLLETIESTQVKDISIRYELRVVQSDVDPSGNVWGLQLDGFLREPVRISGAGEGS